MFKDKYLLASLLSFAFVVPAVLAQDTEEDVEEVVVTGSRIETSEFTGAQPVIVIDQEAIARTNELGIAEVLREMHAFGSPLARSMGDITLRKLIITVIPCRCVSGRSFTPIRRQRKHA